MNLPLVSRALMAALNGMLAVGELGASLRQGMVHLLPGGGVDAYRHPALDYHTSV
jgi:hypothetical protein